MRSGIAGGTVLDVRVVLDTSVLVAAVRSNAGASFALLRLLRRERFKIAISVPLVLEYEAVLLRESHPQTFEADDVGALVDYLCLVGRRQEIFFLWRPLLKDPKDDMVIEVAAAAQCEAVVTHNIRDFSAATRLGIRVLTPGTFLQLLSEK